jgi:hypothetical protein
MNVTNKEFLQAIFGEEWRDAHVTAFPDDPEDINQDNRMRCWAGGDANARRLRSFKPTDNQYFCISLHHRDEKGEPRRRKNLFNGTFVIVADDVKEKLCEKEVNRLPLPSYKLLSSEHSEQWAWILSEPEENADRVNNLLDGLVAQGLAPGGRDPGMKSTTRYVRLPEGSNTKKKRYVDGKPFKCALTEWNPDRLYSLEELAEPFGVDLNAPRNESNGTAAGKGSVICDSHPVWDHVTITGHNGDWTLVNCPNVAAHSSDDASGAAILVRDDGSLAFNCCHGNCEDVTGKKLAELLEISDEVNEYINSVNITGKKALANQLGREVIEYESTGTSKEPLIKRNDDDFNILRYVYLSEENKFFDVCSGGLITNETLKNLYLREWPGKKGVPNAIEKFHTERDADLNIADKLGWVPWSILPPKRSELIVDFAGKRLVNSWRGLAVQPMGGDVSVWLAHLAYLVPDETQQNAILDYLAAVFQRPMEKPAYTILHRGGQGVGKDLLLKPIAHGLGTEASGSEKVEKLIDGWGDILARKKFMIIEEVDKGQSKKVYNALKTLLAPTATGVRSLNLKGGAIITQQDCLATYMMSNKKGALTLEKDDRRVYVVDSYVEKREGAYYRGIDKWYSEEGGIEKVVAFLLARDLTDYNAMIPPTRTEAFLDVLEHGMYDYEIALRELVAENKAPFNLPVFTLTTLKAEVKKHDVKCVVPSLVEAVEDLGFQKCRGTKRTEGKIENTPVFFIKPTTESIEWSKKDEFDYYQKYIKIV